MGRRWTAAAVNSSALDITPRASVDPVMEPPVANPESLEPWSAVRRVLAAIETPRRSRTVLSYSRRVRRRSGAMPGTDLASSRAPLLSGGGGGFFFPSFPIMPPFDPFGSVDEPGPPSMPPVHPRAITPPTIDKGRILNNLIIPDLRCRRTPYLVLSDDVSRSSRARWAKKIDAVQVPGPESPPVQFVLREFSK